MERDRGYHESRNEVWDGVLVEAPLVNNEHQSIVMILALAFYEALNRTGGDVVLPGANVSDRDAGWLKNHRIPDVVVYLATNPSKNCDTHWLGGPDLAVEIISPGEDPYGKLDFYAKVNTREVLIVNREPWAVEVFQLHAGKMALAGRADAANQAVLASAVLPLTFQMRPGAKRPVILVAHAASGQSWTA